MKQLQQVKQTPRGHWVGNGFPVRSLISIAEDSRNTSPFLLLDYAGPYEFPPGGERRGVGQHPHRGFETVTIVYQGEVDHRDNAGNQGSIGPGDVQWMTAAGGVLHEEFHSPAFTARGGALEMVQLWVNLPARDKMNPPRYQAIVDLQIPVVALPDSAGSARVIAGDFAGATGPALTHTPLKVVDLRLRANSDVTLSAPADWTTVLIVQHGEVAVGDRTLKPGDAAHFSRSGEDVRLSVKQDAVVLLLSGEPINEPIAHYGPFVMNHQTELRQAMEDFNAGRFGKFDGAQS